MNSEQNNKDENPQAVIGLFIFMSAVAISIGLGLMYGAGIGCLVFGLFCALVAAGSIQFAKQNRRNQ